MSLNIIGLFFSSSSFDRLEFCSCNRSFAGSSRYFVVGRPSVSASMMSTVGLELANFLNADLSWKRVSKGSRSAPRRPRKPVLEIADKTTRRTDDTTVSESEKVDIANLFIHRFFGI